MGSTTQVAKIVCSLSSLRCILEPLALCRFSDEYQFGKKSRLLSVQVLKRIYHISRSSFDWCHGCYCAPAPRTGCHMILTHSFKQWSFLHSRKTHKACRLCCIENRT